jgi:hypothetical protein
MPNSTSQVCLLQHAAAYVTAVQGQPLLPQPLLPLLWPLALWLRLRLLLAVVPPCIWLLCHHPLRLHRARLSKVLTDLLVVARCCPPFAWQQVSLSQNSFPLHIAHLHAHARARAGMHMYAQTQRKKAQAHMCSPIHTYMQGQKQTQTQALAALLQRRQGQLQTRKTQRPWRKASSLGKSCHKQQARLLPPLLLP